MNVAPWLLVVASIWIAGACIRHALPEHSQQPGNLLSPGKGDSPGASTLLGEFSSSFAIYLWRKADEYIHSGVRMRPMTARERSLHGDAASTDAALRHRHEGQGHEHEREVSLIPHSTDDPRGFWGDIERQVKPYFDEHSHEHRLPLETLPLFRLMTWVDPRFVPGYVVGSFAIRIGKQPKSEDEALAFLEEGLRHNPQSVALRVEIGRCFLRQGAPLPKTLEVLGEAISLGKKRRLVDYEKEGHQDAYRYMALILLRAGEEDESARIAREGAALYPEDAVLRQLSHRR